MKRQFGIALALGIASLVPAEVRSTEASPAACGKELWASPPCADKTYWVCIWPLGGGASLIYENFCDPADPGCI